MNVIEAKAEYLDTRDKTPYEFIERVARTCYKSEDKITSTSANKMIEILAKNKHTAMLEHAHLYFIMDELTLYDITAKLNRQSICIKDKNSILPLENFFNITNTSKVHILSGSFRSFITLCENDISEKHYTICKLREILHNNYPEVFPALSEITVIKPCFWNEDSEQYKIWYDACLYAEKAYFKIIKNGGFAQLARDVLPTSVKTELVITATEIEWQHIINLRYYGTTGTPHPQMVEVMQKAFPILQDNSNYRLK